LTSSALPVSRHFAPTELIRTAATIGKFCPAYAVKNWMRVETGRLFHRRPLAAMAEATTDGPPRSRMPPAQRESICAHAAADRSEKHCQDEEQLAG
jgi:hypothetical protein